MKTISNTYFMPIITAILFVGANSTFAADNVSSGGESVDVDEIVRNARESGAKLGIPSPILDTTEEMIRSGKAGQPGGQPTSDEPVAVLKSCTAQPYVSEAVCLDGSGSYSPSGSKLSLYYFDYKNGAYSVGSSATAETAYSTVGTYYPSLQVMDPNGLWSQPEDLKLVLENRPPDALFNVENANLSTTYTRLMMDASPSRAYNGAKIKTYYWYVCQSVKNQPSKCITSYDMATAIDVPRNAQVRLSGELKVVDTNSEDASTQIRMTVNTY